ncbi:MAG: hypothetical protein F4139_10990 [Gemmatimonadetes bacterium]|nr:hypothetical protein [Gemmatimonadota bacterium]MYH53445.1 hypothetical protein [Gemmatimonadota bacterium]MYK67335.1 hypothetical protein [Gemmatimonadota bacterium]
MNGMIPKTTILVLAILCPSACGMTEIEEVEEILNLTGYYTLLDIRHNGGALIPNQPDHPLGGSIAFVEVSSGHDEGGNARANGFFFMRIRECIPDFAQLIHTTGGDYRQYSDSVVITQTAGIIYPPGAIHHTYTISDGVLSLRSTPPRIHRSMWTLNRKTVVDQDLGPPGAPRCEE